MSKSLQDALGNQAWSVSAVIYDLNDMLDDEARPVSERRSDAAIRVGVEMEMRECPFNDIRRNQLMNVSALTQITRYYSDVLKELAAFRRQCGNNPVDWSDVLASVLDQLAGPAIYLLHHRNSEGPVPARLAVGHKLAAGFLGVVRGIYENLATGEQSPVTVDYFIDRVEQTKALVGTSEVCAGSPKMIRQATEALINGNTESILALDATRMEIARTLADQFQLGIFWELYDQIHLWDLLRGDLRPNLSPRNHFLQGKMHMATEALGTAHPPPPDIAMLPGWLDDNAREQFATALTDRADVESLAENYLAILNLLDNSNSAIDYDGELKPLARRISNYLNTFYLFRQVLSDKELRLRSLLGFPQSVDVLLGASVMPIPQAQHWYELILGGRIGVNNHLFSPAASGPVSAEAGQS